MNTLRTRNITTSLALSQNYHKIGRARGCMIPVVEAFEAEASSSPPTTEPLEPRDEVILSRDDFFLHARAGKRLNGALLGLRMGVFAPRGPVGIMAGLTLQAAGRASR